MSPPIPWPLTRSAATLLTTLYLAAAALLLTNLGLDPFAPEKLGLVFNDMARRLIHWDFTISPAIIQFEAFIRDGTTYAYYGIFPALLRLPLVLAGHPETEIGRLSCLAALGITVYAYLRLVQAALTPRPAPRALTWAALLSVVATGPQIFVLASASLYHEIIFWSAAFTALFTLIVLGRWFRRESLRPADHYILAILAGLALLCRVTAGVGLYAGLLFLLIASFAWHVSRLPPGQRIHTLLGLPPWLRTLFAAGCLSLVFVAVQGVVNHERWGSALVTSPYDHYGQYMKDPAALARYARHGLFSVTRVAMATAYYGTGVKLEAIFPTAFDDYYGGIEGPRAIIPLCAPLLFLLALPGAWRLLRHPTTHAAPALIAAGNLVGVLLVLGFQALCLRYAFDGWGLLTLLAAIGLHAVSGRARPLLGAAAILLLLVGIAASALTLLRYKIVYSGTDPQTRYTLSQRLQPLICPRARLDPTVKLTDFNPLVTPNCPPLW